MAKRIIRAAVSNLSGAIIRESDIPTEYNVLVQGTTTHIIIVWRANSKIPKVLKRLFANIYINPAERRAHLSVSWMSLEQVKQKLKIV